MGQAKIRKEIDANYGKPAIKSDIRGLVISSKMHIAGDSVFVEGGIDPQELRFALFFWDQLAWPTSNIIRVRSSPNEEFLESEGILIRPHTQINFAGVPAHLIAKGHFAAFKELEKQSPGSWALAQGENSFQWDELLMGEGKGALLQLKRAVPIPTTDVPLEEILEFKNRRKDELLLFRQQFESFLSDIETSGNPKETLHKCINEIDQACADLITVGREWQFPVKLSDFKSSFTFNPSRFILSGLAAWTFTHPFGLAAATAASGLATIGSVLDIKNDKGFRSIKAPMSPYKYAYHINNDLNF
jgi:hypothetical protein